MTVETALIFAGVSCACAFLGYQKGNRKDSKQEGASDGELKADVKYIRDGVEGIKVDIKVQERRLNDIEGRVIRVEERCKSNTHRLDDIEGK